MSRTAPRRTDPRWTIIRRVKFAIKVHDAVYGYKARPLTRIARNSWARLLAHYTRARSLTYSETLAVARRWGEVFRSRHGSVPTTLEDDEFLRGMLSLHLADAAREKAARSPPRDEGAHRDGQWRARMRAAIVQLYLDSVCPACGSRLPCREHGCEVVTIDASGKPSPNPLSQFELRLHRMNASGTARR
jgi:hypothetical protein